ncbi:hypothetical protein YC2023_029083 [Brassica napus]
MVFRYLVDDKGCPSQTLKVSGICTMRARHICWVFRVSGIKGSKIIRKVFAKLGPFTFNSYEVVQSLDSKYGTEEDFQCIYFMFNKILDYKAPCQAI